MSLYMKVKNQADGQWLSILSGMFPGMFDEAIERLGQHVRCPFHGGENDFRFIKRSSQGKGTTDQTGFAVCTCKTFTNGFDIVMSALGCQFKDAVVEVDKYLNGDSVQHVVQSAKPQPQPSSLETKQELDNIRARVLKLFESGKKFNIADATYYVERGISASTLKDVQDLRLIDSLGYYEPNQETGELERQDSYPALLALMRCQEGDAVAVHRTWLAKDKTAKAPVSTPKKLTQTTGASGAAIRLFKLEGDTLALTEGIETALAVRQLSKEGYFNDSSIPRTLPVWACFSAANVRSFIVPPTVAHLVILADNDERGTGMAAALALRDKLATTNPTVKVTIKQPEAVGMDYLDVLVNE